MRKNNDIVGEDPTEHDDGASGEKKREKGYKDLDAPEQEDHVDGIQTDSESGKTDFTIGPPSSLPPTSPPPPPPPSDERPKDPRLRKRKLEDDGTDDPTENSWYKDYSAAMQYNAPPKRFLNKVVDLHEQYEDVDIIPEGDHDKDDAKKIDAKSKEHAVDLQMVLSDKDPDKKV